MTSRTPDETHAYYRATLGYDFGDTYYFAHGEWCELWIIWKQFKNLFGHGPERVALLNKCGSNFFYFVDRLFFESILLSICRLSDPPASMGKTNLTTTRFQQFMDTEPRQVKMCQLLGDVSSATNFARDWRNRRISHNDYHLKIGTANPLEIATINRTNNAILSLFEVFRFINEEFMKSNLSDDVIDDYNNEMVLLDRLYLGDLRREEEIKATRVDWRATIERPKWLGDAQ